MINNHGYLKFHLPRLTGLENTVNWLNETCPNYTGISTCRLLLILLVTTVLMYGVVWFYRVLELGGDVCLSYHGNEDAC